MLRSDRKSLSVEVASELRDALQRRQKELPPRWIAALDAETLRDGTQSAPTHALESTERDLALTVLHDRLPDARPRGVVCVRPSASGASGPVVHSLCARGAVTAIAAAEWNESLAHAMLHRIVARSAQSAVPSASGRPTGNGDDPSSAAIECDCTIELPLPHTFPRPRVYLCLGNVLGNSTTVGAVRMLRVLRTTMSPGDTIILGLEVPRDIDPAQPSDSDVDAARHLGVLSLVNSTTGAAFDVHRFDYRPRYDADNGRLETHLVARRAFELEVPGVGDVRFRKGESIRTAVSCTFDKNRVAAMMTGVGLALREWATDLESKYVVATATPAV